MKRSLQSRLDIALSKSLSKSVKPDHKKEDEINFIEVKKVFNENVDNMMSTLESGSLEFGLKFDKLLSSDSENVAFSPFSLSTALTMALLGAHKESGEELSNVLFGKIIKPNEYQSLAKEYQILVERCLKTNEEVLRSANFLYSHINYPILQNYKQMIESSFGAKTQELDFKRREAVDTINRDISDATNGKIPTLLDPSSFDPTTQMVLANALYFKGLWDSDKKFRKEDTMSQKFTTNDKTKIDVQMMLKKSRFPFVESQPLKCRAIQLDYEKCNVVMVVILPDKNSSVNELKSELNAQTLDQLLKGLTTQRVDLYLPKFKIESTFKLIPVLSEIGIKQIFDRNLSNFEGITDHPLGLYVSDVIQKAIIEVNEEGTEAAAATALYGKARGRGPPPQEPKLFKANRPFMFLLLSKYHSNKYMLLFSGTVNNPNV